MFQRKKMVTAQRLEAGVTSLLLKAKFGMVQ